MYPDALNSSLSIVIPTLNPRPDLLREALCSIGELFVAHPNIEVLVVDNGSKTPVQVVLRSWVPEFNSIKFVRFEENLGFSRNLHRAAQVASSELIWFIGDDDLVKAERGALNSLADMLSMNPAIALNVNYFRDGDPPNWLIDGCDESNWAGSALSSLIFQRSSFIRASEKILEITQDTIWLHFLVFHHLNAEREATQISASILPQIAVRIGRNANWESHFGSQYLAGISCLKSLSEMCQVGMYPVDSFADQVRSRISTNFLDVVTLTSSLNSKEMILARRALHELSVVASVKVPILSSLGMLTPMTVRKLIAQAIKLLGQLKSYLRLKLVIKRSRRS